MNRKRKLVSENSAHKSIPVEVIVEDLTSHPLCLHGPTLLFSNEKGRYYACSSCRNKKDCSIHIDEEDWQKESVRKRNEKYYNLILKLEKAKAWKNFLEVKSHESYNRVYCTTCQQLFVHSRSRNHSKDHCLIMPLTDEHMAKPSSFLPTLENDAVEAQYMFSKKSISTVLGILRNNNIKNIICIGTPTIHEAAQSTPNFNSILLDLDSRHHLFHSPNKFLWYNMFNNYLFNGNDDEKVLQKFIKHSRNDGICVVMDPPFGGRVEPLTNTLNEISAAWRTICETPEGETIPVIWAFPYFSEPYITNLMPEMKMHDYQVQYENHNKFHNNKNGRKFGSPIRFFTNLPFDTIDLSNDSDYKLCKKCNYWVSSSNNHCYKCQECTSKNGMTYKHCHVCERCVKPTFVHCGECERCVLEKGHVCGAIVESQSCYNCKQKGHKQSNCPKRRESKKKKRKHA